MRGSGRVVKPSRAILLAGLLAIVAAEIGLRVLTSADSRWNVRLGAAREFDPIAGFRNKPGYELAPGIRTNALGYQAPQPLRVAPPSGVRRAIFLGDSNSVMPTIGAYPQQVEALLDAELPGEIEVVNAAVPGYSSDNARNLFEHELSRFEGDYFFVYLGWNDLGQFGPEGLPYKRQATGYQVTPVQRVLSSIYLLRYAFLMPSMLDRERETFDRPLDAREQKIYGDYRPTHFERNLRQILSLAKRRYPHVFVMNLATITNADPTPSELQRAHFPRGMGKNMRKLDLLVRHYNDSVAVVAREQGVSLIDLHAAFDSREARETFTDSCHMNRAGAARVARLIADEIGALEQTRVRDLARPAADS